MDFVSLKENIEGKNVTLVVVSKTQSIEAIQALYNQGQRIFGENKVQELIEKETQLPKDILWHLIGSLQTNKVKQILPHIVMIQSVDSLKLYDEIEKQASKLDKTIDILLQIKIAQEESKSGFNFEELLSFIESGKIKSTKNVRIRGVMGMASFTDENSQVEKEFLNLQSQFNFIKTNHFNVNEFDTISMGMSDDYEMAINCGSNMIRIGSLLFGKRV